MAALPKEAVIQLKSFITLVKSKPEILHIPDLEFFKEFIESFGGKVPPPASKSMPSKQSAAPPQAEPEREPSPEPESEESDVELDNSGVIAEPDDAVPLLPLDDSLEVKEELMDQANEKKREAIAAYSEQEYDRAAELYTEAINLNPGLALLYAKRGQCYLQVSKPNACIRDCTRALEINPDCAPAYKFRGRAHRLLGKWEQAAQDLRNACKIDFDEQADEWLKEVTPNARKLEEHKLKYERKQREKELKEKKERIRRAKEASEKARQEAADQEDMEGELGGGMGGMGGLFNLLNDPEVMQAFKDPEVAAAFQDISQNPSNYMKYTGNPKIMKVIEKLSGKYSGMAGGFPGGFPGTNPPPPPPPSGNDTELD